MTAELGSLYFSFLYFLNRQKDCRDSYGNLNENFRKEINSIQSQNPSYRDFNKRNNNIAKIGWRHINHVYSMCLYIFSFIRRVYFLLLQFLDFEAKDYKRWIGHIGSRKRGRWLLYIYISLVGPKPLRVFEAHDLEHDTMHRGRKFLPSIGPLNRVTLHRRPIILTGL